ncbi:YadA-like family protein [Pasteurella atlantica]|uniref:YadA-like family protein n=1 Tax=Pasteurellaceae TaxID=712 RepID=UPI00274E27AF|nr:YadA-like family protein [Pasteurella atlantica]MDP8033330.1 YadA-like family protein [Pasteurella atlantica]MDP8035266.1 YadA-like family protein [Pasteurella atlantica]MDP8037217.1 YadA-like family protein [Pasteurella atlantica]MDP8047670.1 YadA-like family protein [Pasteurella atlantica]MDP8049519.1 YadA-like family protein [Pasteurella atlantica]
MAIGLALASCQVYAAPTDFQDGYVGHYNDTCNGKIPDTTFVKVLLGQGAMVNTDPNNPNSDDCRPNNVVAVGHNAIVGADNTIAIGHNAQATKREFGPEPTSAIAIGRDAHSMGINSLAVGAGAKVIGDHSMAFTTFNPLPENIPQNAKPEDIMKGNNSIVMSTNSAQRNIVNANMATLIGGVNNKIDGGTYGAILGGENNYVAGEYALAFGKNNIAQGKHSLMVGLDNNKSHRDGIESNSNKATSDGYVAIGKQNEVDGWYAFGLGEENHSYGFNSTALGYRNKAIGDGSIAMGGYNDKQPDQTYKFIDGAQALSKGAIAIGAGTIAGFADKSASEDIVRQWRQGTEEAVAIGYRSKAVANKTIALGFDAEANIQGGIALGSYAKAIGMPGTKGIDVSGRNGADDTATWKSTLGALAIGDTDGTNKYTRQITGLAAGTNDTDAVNVAQLRQAVTLPTISFYNGGSLNGANYTQGTNINLSSLAFDFGDGLKVQKTTKDGKDIALVTLDKDALKNDPNFKGDKGDKGEKGDQGIQGLKGPKGDTGAKGDKGDQGIQGPKGDTGAKGDKGDQGIQGLKGPKGDTGAKGEKGDQGIQGLKGPKGDTGAKGEKGDQGIQGLKGPKGDTGAKGEKGDQGIQGLKGPKGDTGAKGDKGDRGIQGDKGDQGIQSPKGSHTNNSAAIPNSKFDQLNIGNVIMKKTDTGKITINMGKNQIHGVANGTAPTDAVNVSQLNEVKNTINNVEKQANKGIAGSMAVAGLPQAYLPGKNMVAVAGSNYKGANAIAIGISTISNDGKWIIKGSLNSTSGGSVGTTLGAGYQW